MPTLRRDELPVALLERMAQILKILAHPHRLRLIDILQRRREAPVHKLTEAVDLPQAAVSHHLSLLRRVGLVRCTRRGKESWYAVDDERPLFILECIRRHGGKR